MKRLCNFLLSFFLLSLSFPSHRVEEEVSSAKAPPAKRMKSCSDLKQRVVRN